MMILSTWMLVSRGVLTATKLLCNVTSSCFCYTCATPALTTGNTPPLPALTASTKTGKISSNAEENSDASATQVIDALCSRYVKDRLF